MKKQDEQAKQVIERNKERGEANAPTEVQDSLTEPGRPQDTMDPRAKNSGKGKKTADKWNQ
jgi:hypothetical protein